MFVFRLISLVFFICLTGCVDSTKNDLRGTAPSLDAKVVKKGEMDDSKPNTSQKETDIEETKLGSSKKEETNFLTSSHPSSKVRQLLQKYCHSCHGGNQSSQGGLSQVLDLNWLKNNGYIKPGSADASVLWQRMEQNMPPVSHPQPTGKERKTIQNWINSGAELEQGFVERNPIKLSEIYGRAASNLDSVDTDSKQNIRYIMLTNSYNAGYDENYLEDLRQASIKLMNNLSLSQRVAKLEIVPGTEQTLLKINLQDFGWDANRWKVLINNYPYLIPKAEGGFLLELQTKTGERAPIIRADWFIANASIAPLYYRLLDIPTTQGGFYNDPRIAVDWQTKFEEAKQNPNVILRAGFNGSQVAEFSRVLERVDLNNGGFLWQSYEFGGDAGNKNPFINPLGPIRLTTAATVNNDIDRRERGIGSLFGRSSNKNINRGSGFARLESKNAFAHDGNEIIFTLPNKMLAFAVFNSDGSRRDKAPSGTIDKTSTSTEVTIGVSCMSCHFKGLIDKNDQIREATINSGLFDENPEFAEIVRNIYADGRTFTSQIEKDSEVFQDQLQKIDVRIDREDPILRVFNTFNRHTIDISKAAFELDISTEALKERILNSNTNLKAVLSPLLAEGGSISRAIFENSVSALKDQNEKSKTSPFEKRD